MTGIEFPVCEMKQPWRMGGRQCESTHHSRAAHLKVAGMANCTIACCVNFTTTEK